MLPPSRWSTWQRSAVFPFVALTVSLILLDPWAGESPADVWSLSVLAAVASATRRTATRAGASILLHAGDMTDEGDNGSENQGRTVLRREQELDSADDSRPMTRTQTESMQAGKGFSLGAHHVSGLTDLGWQNATEIEGREEHGRRLLTRTIPRGSGTRRRRHQEETYTTFHDLDVFPRQEHRVGGPHREGDSDGPIPGTRRKTAGGRTRDFRYTKSVSSSKLSLLKMALLISLGAVVSGATTAFYVKKTLSAPTTAVSGGGREDDREKADDSQSGEERAPPASRSSSPLLNEAATADVLASVFLVAGFTVLAMVLIDTGEDGARNPLRWLQDAAVTLSRDQFALVNPTALLLSAYAAFLVLRFVVTPSAGLVGITAVWMLVLFYDSTRTALRLLSGTAELRDVGLLFPVWAMVTIITVVTALRFVSWPWKAMHRAREKAIRLAEKIDKQRGRE